ncbi:MAG: hypothetical protein FD119_2834 [Stygiobacter sp.]|nr:MAG: hypothetical protein FD119_2834 [Stygiobacter sp.]
MDEPLLWSLFKINSSLIDLSGFVGIPILRGDFSGGYSSEYMEEISTGRWIHVIHSIGDFKNWSEGGFAFTSEQSPEFREKLRSSIEKARAHASSHGDFSHGMTIFFSSGWGEARAIEFDPTQASDWHVLSMDAYDSFILGGCEDANIKDIYWMQLQYDLVREQGFYFIGANGFLNLFQFWRETAHFFVPQHGTDIRPPVNINFATNYLLKARLEAYRAWDRRALPLPSGQHLTVMRMHPHKEFGDLEPVYAFYDGVRSAILLSALLINDTFPVWVRYECRNSDDISENALETFKALLSCSSRVFQYALRKLPPESQPIIIHLKAEFSDNDRQPIETLSDAEITQAINVRLDANARAAWVTLAPEWQLGLQRTDNFAEAAMTAATLSAAATLLNLPAPQDGVGFVRSILGGADARWRHAMEVTRTVEALKVHGLVNRFTAIPNSVSALVKTGLGWANRHRDQGAIIEGKEACRAFLDSQTALLLERLRESLRHYRRAPMLVAALKAIHSAQAEEQLWKNTARALRAIHGREGDHRNSLDRQMEVNAVLRASSILVELAQADCPLDEGRVVGTMDLIELQALAIILFLAADMIPALEGGRLKARFHISPTGDVLHDHEFADGTLRRTGEVVHEAQRDHAVKNYMRVVAPENEQSASPDGLEDAVLAEFGVGFDRYISLHRICGEIAIERGVDVFILRRSELIRELDRDTSGDDISALVDRMTLLLRPKWDDLPPGTSPRDFDLAKMDRRYSLIGRPIVNLDGDEDPSLVVAPAVIERSIIHNLSGMLSGSLQNEFWTTTPMQKFSSRRGEREGLRFNDKVAEALRALGLDAYPSAKPSWCFNHKNTPEVQALGDFDVLAFTPDGTRVWIVEAKDLKLCRTLGEAARRLSEYEGKLLPSGKPDKLLRHLRRLAYAREHIADLTKKFKLPQEPIVEGIMVVNAPQPIETLSPEQIPDARVVMLNRLGEVPWQHGWDKGRSRKGNSSTKGGRRQRRR